ncbi:hypothetical protein KAFR_0C00860 [Kazachstania africana CBS 2517]|uniref:EamA domain-containing protein n=1 Tax=Kazachstania africana (strain ATCC 22294 / BCRC 22015 / CBS 2517 / CECT 1963 / NBRC 1671 / NRRL Y-8276) TaxID=1071382 RepID=H2ART1_KAZAF|nr:hypothetical protein KAFR_0C00860 [Kazachstania africana CBS 2517]CCF57081.1 hypothetical protein KAFR_0C00860 [Kazachstania africana CBS 2517]
MSTKVLWLTTVGSYLVQTRSLSAILAKTASLDATNSTVNTHKEPNITVHVTMIYFASWFLLLPLSKFWTSNENDESFNLSPPLHTTISIKEKLYHIIKLTILSVCIVISILTYAMGLSLTPSFDVCLIQNTAMFEIITLLYGVCNITKKQNSLFRNFIVMMIALISILIISYTKATCDLLAGKLYINKTTGELNDPYLFDRLQAALICGLGSLAIGPFAVLANKWLFQNGDNSSKLVNSKRDLSIISGTSFIMLAMLLPTNEPDFSFFNHLTEKKLWTSLLVAIFCGILPNIISIIKLNNKAPPEFITTCNLGSIFFMGIVDWICEPEQTMIVRWEVIGYIMLTLSSLILFISLHDGRK